MFELLQPPLRTRETNKPYDPKIRLAPRHRRQTRHERETTLTGPAMFLEHLEVPIRTNNPLTILMDTDQMFSTSSYCKAQASLKPPNPTPLRT